MTLKKLAKICSLDISTISRALNDDPRVKTETIARVKSAAQKSGYKPNLAARALAAGTGRTIWLIIPGLTNPIENRPAEYAAKYLGGKGWDLLAAVYNSDRIIFERLLDRLKQGVCDGAIVIGIEDWGKDRLKKLKDQGYPIIMLDRPDGSVNLPAVTTDNYKAVKQMLNRLEKSGCRNFINLYNNRDYVASQRNKAAVSWLKKKGYPCIQGTENIHKLYKKRLSAGGATGIIGTSQVGIMDYCSGHMNILAERKTCIALFDDWIGSIYPAKKVYVCYQDFKKMAETAASQLLQMINGKRNTDISSIPFRKISCLENQS